MKKGEILEGTVERIEFPNKGIVVCEEGSCVVKNALPGQRVSFRVSKARKGKAEGRLLKVLEKSPLETGSPCSCFGVCGGCTYLSLRYEEQLRIKEEQVKKLLESVLRKQKKNMCMKESSRARCRMNIGIRWNFLLEMRKKTVRWLWGCIKGEAFMIS